MRFKRTLALLLATSMMFGQMAPIISLKSNKKEVVDITIKSGSYSIEEEIPDHKPNQEIKTLEKEVELEQDEIELISLITVAEAEGECEEGKRLVIDTILNRMDHEKFPDTVTDVIYQKNQFTSVSDGRAGRCEVTDDVRNLVKEELISRTNKDVIFFTSGRYSNFGTPMFQVGNHHFSSF